LKLYRTFYLEAAQVPGVRSRLTAATTRRLIEAKDDPFNRTQYRLLRGASHREGEAEVLIKAEVYHRMNPAFRFQRLEVLASAPGQKMTWF
jgi:hypothetical protein